MPGSKLTKWIHDRVENLPFRNRPPYLPSTRPRPLTPASSTEVLVQPPSCLLFTRIPALMRHDILLLAFGNRTLHMHLVFGLPLFTPPEEHAWDTTLAKCTRHHAAIYEPDPNDEDLRPKVWRWSSCICHASRTRHDSLLPARRYAAMNIYNDRCLEGKCDVCRGENSVVNWPGDGQIGIMGFLLSCKQAYAESINILYGANTIILSSESLLLHLPRLIPPQRLANITSLELIVKARYAEKYSTKHDYSHLVRILDNVAAQCKESLRTLSLSLTCRRSSEPESMLDDPALRHIDTFYLSMQLRDMRVEIPDTSFQICRKRAVIPYGKQHALENRVASKYSFTLNFLLWRCLDDEQNPQTQLSSFGSYPDPPLQLATPENEGKRVISRGYWVGSGLNDYRRNPWMVCF